MFALHEKIAVLKLGPDALCDNQLEVFLKRLDKEPICALLVVVDDVEWQFYKQEIVTEEIKSWLGQTSVLTFIVLNRRCCSSVLDLAMLFDIRLCGDDFSIKFPQCNTSTITEREKNWRFLIGYKGVSVTFEALQGRELKAQELLYLNFVNSILDLGEDYKNVYQYINAIIANRTEEHVKAIKTCFNHYKKLGLEADKSILLDVEARIFYELVVKSWENMRDEDEV